MTMLSYMIAKTGDVYVRQYIYLVVAIELVSFANE